MTLATCELTERSVPINETDEKYFVAFKQFKFIIVHLDFLIKKN